MKEKFVALLTIGLLIVVLVLSGCLEQQTGQRCEQQLDVEGGEIDMDDIRINRSPRHGERMRNNMNYIFVSDLDLAPCNVNLNTIERFVFVNGVEMGGSFSVVIDRMFEKVYHGNSGLFYRQLDRAPFSAAFIDEDLTRLIEAIENSDFRNWQEHYQGTMVEGALGGTLFWRIGIEFSDGSVMRRSGTGHVVSGVDDHYPPQEQWDILTNFINTLGQEIIERHNAENPQADE